MSPIIVFTLMYILLCACIIYPPTEFVSAGITIPSIFSFCLGSQTENFIKYHIKRSMVSLFVYSLMPICYYVGLIIFNVVDEMYLLAKLQESHLWKMYITTCFVLPLLALYQILNWSRDNYKNHPIVLNLVKFYNNNSDWTSVASDINVEYRSVEKICLQTSSISEIIATENWILRISPLTVHIAHQSDASLVVKQSDTHRISHISNGDVQYVIIDVNSARENVASFTIRLNATDFRLLQDRVARTIDVLPSVSFHKSLTDKFIDAFKEVIQENPRYTTDQELENCIGCLQTKVNVKLQKLCTDDDSDDGNCVTCYCRPMWCVDCMAQWFASRQDSNQPESWLSSKCTCPMCRAKFCVLDVCLIEL